jgi:hypothetical protein
MNEQRIREIANESSYHAENSVDYYSGIVDGLTWEAKILKARDLKFAELIVRECMKEAWEEIVDDEDIAAETDPQIREYLTGQNQGIVDAVIRFRNHFGVEE